MKTLILVLSHLQEGYEEFIDTQKETWDSIKEPGIETFYYYAGKAREGKDNEWGIDIDGSIENTYNKMILAFRKALEYKWDYLFRTNSTSYVVKPFLSKIVKQLKRENTIAGQLGHYPYCFKNTGHVQGFSMIISRDVVQMLVDKYPTGIGMDAEVMSRYLFDNENIFLDNRHAIHGVTTMEGVDIENIPHIYRINKSVSLKDRLLLMRSIHKLITSDKTITEEKKRED